MEKLELTQETGMLGLQVGLKIGLHGPIGPTPEDFNLKYLIFNKSLFKI